MIRLEEIIGKSKSDVENIAKDYIVASNNVNCTLELKDVACTYSIETCHVLLYFDLVSGSSMIMAVVKMDSVNILERIKLFFSKTIRCGEYVGQVTLFKKSAAIAFVHEDTIKAL